MMQFGFTAALTTALLALLYASASSAPKASTPKALSMDSVNNAEWRGQAAMHAPGDGLDGASVLHTLAEKVPG